MADLSTPAQRSGFTNSIEAGAPNMVLAAACAQSPVPMTDVACIMLDLPIGSTMAQGAAKLGARPAPGLSVY